MTAPEPHHKSKVNVELELLVKETLQGNHVALNFRLPEGVPEPRPGQFVEILPPSGTGVLLRRPISVCDYVAKQRTLTLLIHAIGPATRAFAKLMKGESLNVVMSLGKGFDLANVGEHPLLVGGGVGVAPLLYAARCLQASGIKPTMLLGAKTATLLVLTERFKAFGDVQRCTDDGTKGFQGFVVHHRLMLSERFQKFTSVLCCGPTPMMKAVAQKAHEAGLPCQVSLEHLMACGFGVCLGCVQNTTSGNLRVCADGPVFNAETLIW